MPFKYVFVGHYSPTDVIDRFWKLGYPQFIEKGLLRQPFSFWYFTWQGWLCDVWHFLYDWEIDSTHIENPRAYMVGILSRLYGNYIRSKERTTFPSDKIPEKSPSSDDASYSLTDVLPAELLPWEREILLLRYSAGLSFAEIAQRLHIKESSCRSRHLRAKAHLKSLMQD